MTFSSDSQPTEPRELPAELSHQDPVQRLQAIEKLVADESLFMHMASNDSDAHVRAAAAVRIETPALLEELAQLSRQKDKTVYRHCKDRLAALQRQQAQQLMRQSQAAGVCQSIDALTGKPVGPLTSAQTEYLETQWQQLNDAATADMREKVDQALLALQALINDYNTQKAETSRIEESRVQLQDSCAETEEFIKSLGATVEQDVFYALGYRLSSLQTMLPAFEDDESEELKARCSRLINLLSAHQAAWKQLQAKAGSISRLAQALDNTSHKNSNTLISLQQKMDKLFSAASWPEGLPVSTTFRQCEQIQQTLSEILHENSAWQETLLQQIQQYIQELELKIEEGHIGEAQRLWDKIQSAISRLAAEHRQGIQDQVAPSKARITELLDWKNFAATEKKKELISKMQQLSESEMNPTGKAKQIKALQEEWKKLGYSDHNDLLWTQFSELGHQAFEPCKEYFHARKEQMSNNLLQRNTICEQLEAYAASLHHEDLNIAEMNKLESEAQTEWKRYAPVAPNKIKPLQKRFNAVLNSLRQLRRKALQHNASRKLALIEQAKKLTEIADFKDAVAQAKSLQNEWKTIGPSPYKEDRKHWADFRAACDQLFQQRDQQRKQEKEAGSESLNKARTILKSLSALLSLDDEPFLDSRKDFSALKNDFFSLLTPDMKSERKKLTDQFDVIARKYDNRMRKAPDRKTLLLSNLLNNRAEFCAQAEEKVLLASEDIPAIEQLQSQWQELEPISNTELAHNMEQRFAQLCQHLDKPEAFQQLATKAEADARKLCVEMEIQSGSETPAEDKALRMQCQLEQLKSGFGQRAQNEQARASVLHDLQNRFAAIGPLPAKVRKSLQLRINTLRNR